MEETFLPIVYHTPKKLNEVNEKIPMINPITYELVNQELWEDGLHLFPNILDEDLKINMVCEIKNNKVVRVYKSKN